MTARWTTGRNLMDDRYRHPLRPLRCCRHWRWPPLLRARAPERRFRRDQPHQIALGHVPLFDLFSLAAGRAEQIAQHHRLEFGAQISGPRGIRREDRRFGHGWLLLATHCHLFYRADGLNGTFLVNSLSLKLSPRKSGGS